MSAFEEEEFVNALLAAEKLLARRHFDAIWSRIHWLTLERDAYFKDLKEVEKAKRELEIELQNTLKTVGEDMHHGDDSNNDTAKKLFKEMFGATGEFPEGKLNENDQGEIKFGVAADNDSGKILLSFGKPIAWVGMSPGQAIALADSLRDKARFLAK